MTARLPSRLVTAIDQSKILGIRAGSRSDHRFTGVWPVVVKGRVFVRSWSLKPDGWYLTFIGDPLASISRGEQHLSVRAGPLWTAAARRCRGGLRREIPDSRFPQVRRWIPNCASARSDGRIRAEVTLVN